MARSYANNTGVKVTRANAAAVLQGVRLVASVEVLVGVPADKTDRDDGTPLTNAALAYIHDQGSPEAHIPQREFMRPGIAAAQEDIEKGLSGALKAGMRGNTLRAEQALIAVGTRAAMAIRNKIDEGVPPPLADYTVRKRAARGRKGAKLEMANRAAGQAPAMDLAKPLVDTGEMRKSITYAIRPRKARR